MEDSHRTPEKQCDILPRLVNKVTSTGIGSGF